MKKFVAIAATVVILCAAALYLAVAMTFPVKHLDIIRENAGQLEPSFVLAVIMAESSFNPSAQSPVGAQGLMQLMPPTAQDMANRLGLPDFTPEDVWEPATNIKLGTFYLNWLYQRYHGNLDLVLAAYNAGLGRVDAWLNDPGISSDGENLDRIPFTETHNYLNRVRTFQRIYRVLLAVRR